VCERENRFSYGSQSIKLQSIGFIHFSSHCSFHGINARGEGKWGGGGGTLHPNI